MFFAASGRVIHLPIRHPCFISFMTTNGPNQSFCTAVNHHLAAGALSGLRSIQLIYLRIKQGWGPGSRCKNSLLIWENFLAFWFFSFMNSNFWTSSFKQLNDGARSFIFLCPVRHTDPGLLITWIGIHSPGIKAELQKDLFFCGGGRIYSSLFLKF
jgi:hypothetical protein